MNPDIQHLQDLLAIYRETVMTLTKQKAIFGSAHVPANIVTQLNAAIDNIINTKQTLRQLGATVEDSAIDPPESNLGGPSAAATPAPAPLAPTPSVSIGTINAQNVNTGTQQIDKLTINQGDTFTFSGNFDKNIINIGSTLNNVTQQTSALPSNNAQEDAVKKLASELVQQLKQAEQQGQQELVAKATKRLDALLNEYNKSQPDTDELEVQIEALFKFINQLQQYVPSVVNTAEHLKRALLPG